MLKKIQTFFENNFLPVTQHSVPLEQQLNLAAAALLIEMMMQDQSIDAVEIEVIKETLKSRFNLSGQEVDELFLLAQAQSKQATDYYQFTKLIAQHYTQAQKIKLIESLWLVAFADQSIDKYEENMVRRISDLIHVSHKDFIQAKFRAQKNSVK